MRNRFYKNADRNYSAMKKKRNNSEVCWTPNAKVESQGDVANT